MGVIKGLNGKPIKCIEKVNFVLSMNLYQGKSSIKRCFKTTKPIQVNLMGFLCLKITNQL